MGRLSGTRGRVWQYTAIDLATSYVWDELATTPLNPSARQASLLARRMAAELSAAGWRLERVLTDIQATWTFASHVVGRSWKDAEVRLPSAVAQ